MKPAAASRRALVYLLAVLLLIALLLEGVGRGFGHVSRIQRRINSDYSAAIKMPASVNGKPTMLLVGNSLLLEGVNPLALHKAMADQYDVQLFTVEQTSYRDWYYGMRRLFDAGSRPSVVVLCLSAQQFTVESVRWGYFAHFLMDLRDLPSVVRHEHLDATTASTYFLANLSAWIGVKTEIRNWLLVKTLPDILELGNIFPDLPPLPALDTVRKAADSRFLEMQQIFAPYGTRLIVLLPPSADTSDPAATVEGEGPKAGVSVLVPYRPGEMKLQYFRDGFHLNAEGARLFTARLAEQLRVLPPAEIRH